MGGAEVDSMIRFIQASSDSSRLSLEVYFHGLSNVSGCMVLASVVLSCCWVCRSRWKASRTNWRTNGIASSGKMPVAFA